MRITRTSRYLRSYAALRADASLSPSLYLLQAKRWDLATNQATQVAAHDAPVSHLAWIKELNMLVTGETPGSLLGQRLCLQKP